MGTNFSVAHETRAGSGEDEFLRKTGFGVGAFGDSRLDVISFHPVGEPFQVAIAQEGIGTEGSENKVIKCKPRGSSI